MQLLSRLGHKHVWATLGRPQGLLFYLDASDPEQKEIARELVRMGVKDTKAAKEAAKKEGRQQVGGP